MRREHDRAEPAARTTGDRPAALIPPDVVLALEERDQLFDEMRLVEADADRSLRQGTGPEGPARRVHGPQDGTDDPERQAGLRNSRLQALEVPGDLGPGFILRVLPH